MSYNFLDKDLSTNFILKLIYNLNKKYTHTHTHTHTYIYIYNASVCENINSLDFLPNVLYNLM